MTSAVSRLEKDLKHNGKTITGPKSNTFSNTVKFINKRYTGF